MGKERLSHYIEFYLSELPASAYSIKEIIIPETSVMRINKKENLSKLKIPEEAFGYRFFDRREYVSRSGEVLAGRRINQSAMHFLGKIITLENITKEVPNADLLKSIMKQKGYERMVKTRRGNFQPLGKRDVILTGM